MAAGATKTKDNVLQQARTAFRAVAGNLTNQLVSVEELRTALCVTGRNPSVKQCQEAWDAAKAGDEVDFTEFCEIVSELPRPSKKELLAAFQALDTNGDGSLDVDELKSLLTNLVEKAKQAVLDEAALEKSSTAVRRTCLEQQQVIAAEIATRQKAIREAEAAAEKRAIERAHEEAKQAEERELALKAAQQKKEAKAAAFQKKIAEKREQALAAEAALRSIPTLVLP